MMATFLIIGLDSLAEAAAAAASSTSLVFSKYKMSVLFA